MVFFLAQEYLFVKSLVQVLIPDSLFRKDKAVKRKRNLNCSTEKKLPQPLPSFCLDTILEYKYIGFTKASQNCLI